MAFLKQTSFFGCIVLPRHFISEWSQLALSLPILFLFYVGVPVVRLAFIVACGPLSIDLEAKCLLGELWAFKDVTEISWADGTTFLVSIL